MRLCGPRREASVTLAQARPSTAAGSPRPRTAPPPRPPTGPPPRPRVTSDLPMPGAKVQPRTPRAVRAGTVLWTLGLGAGLIAVAASAIDVSGLRSDLYLSARDADPERPSQVLHDSVNVTIVGAAVFTGVVLLALLVGTVLLHRRRPAAGWLLPVAGVLTLGAVVLDQGLVDGGATNLDRLSFLAL